MLTRPASILLVAGSLSIGLVMGSRLGRGGPELSAQVGGAAAVTSRSTVASAEARRVSQVQQTDAKVYEELAREYDRFRHVDRMFELVSKEIGRASCRERVYGLV